MSVRLALALASGLFAATAATAQAPADSEIVVTGTRGEIRAELGRMLEVSGGQLARFEDPLCPLIAGFDAQYTAILHDLILANARALGARTGKPGCEPNAIVIFIDRPQALVEAMRERRPSSFGEMSLPARDRLTRPLRASYSWHANYVTGADGRTANDARDVPGLSELGPAYEGIPTIRAFTASRLYSPAIQVMGAAFVVMDINRTPGMTLDQIADFATLNLLVDFDEDAAAQARPDSILRLFDAPNPADAPARMSGFDRAMATALYTPDTLSQPASNVRMQLATIIKSGKHKSAND